MRTQKHITAETIMNRVSRIHKQRASVYNLGDFIEWCAECETEYLGDVESMVLVKSLELEVDDNQQALLPCNVYRLLDICLDSNMTTRVEVYNDGVHLTFDDNFGANKVYISYYGIALDDRGYPLIKQGHEQACEAFCIKKIYEEPYMQGQVNENQWQNILGTLSTELTAAEGSFRHYTRNDLEKILKIMGNIAPQPGIMPKFNIDK